MDHRQVRAPIKKIKKSKPYSVTWASACISEFFSELLVIADASCVYTMMGGGCPRGSQNAIEPSLLGHQKNDSGNGSYLYV